MALTEIPELKYEISGDLINLEQGEMEASYVSLHRIHFDHIAGKLGFPTLSTTADMIRRKLELITYRLNTLAEAEHYRSEIIEHCGSGIEFIIELDALCDLANEFLKDVAQAPAIEGSDK